MAKIFIAEDSAIVRRCLTSLLMEIPGVELVGEASESNAALKAIRAIKPHIVILEIHLRDGGGLELLRTIKAGRSSPIVIIFASHSYPQILEACFNAGADFFYTKSQDFTALTGIIRRLTTRGNDLLARIGLTPPTGETNRASSPNS